MLAPLLSRDAELARLRAMWLGAVRERPRLIAVYGRRQAGKTFLMQHFRLEVDAPATSIYFTALQAGTPRLQLEAFRRVVAVALGADAYVPASFSSWLEALAFVTDHATRQATLLVLDEVPYLVEADPTFPSVVQQVWDDLRARATPPRLMVVLTGSAMATMLSLLAAGTGALHGRLDDELRITPFSLRDARRFVLQDCPPERALEAYAATGGYPRHLLSWNQSQTTADNLTQLFGTPGGLLLRNGRQLLADVPDAGGYQAVLGVIGAGEHRRSAIGARVGQRIERPLELLRSSLLVRQERPVGSPPSAPAHYVLADTFLSAWYALCFGDEEDVEAGLGDAVLRRRRGRWERHVAAVFEQEARVHARRLQAHGELPDTDALGRWWTAAAEIDVLGLRGHRTCLLGEAKWQAAPLTTGIFGSLQAKLGQAPDPSPDTVLATWSRGGGSPELGAAGVRSWSVADMVGD